MIHREFKQTCVVSSDHQSGSAFQIGETPVTYIATSESGGAKSCIFYITVKVPDPLNLNCNPSVIKQVAPAGETSVPVYFKAVATGGTPMYSISYEKKPGSLFEVGSSTVVSANVVDVDAGGQLATCTFKINVVTDSCTKLSDVVIISAIVGGVVVIIVLSASVLCCCMKRRRSSKGNSPNYATTLPPHTNAAYVQDIKQGARVSNTNPKGYDTDDYQKRLENKRYQDPDSSRGGQSPDKGIYEVYEICS